MSNDLATLKHRKGELRKQLVVLVLNGAWLNSYKISRDVVQLFSSVCILNYSKPDTTFAGKGRSQH